MQQEIAKKQKDHSEQVRKLKEDLDERATFQESLQKYFDDTTQSIDLKTASLHR